MNLMDLGETDEGNETTRFAQVCIVGGGIAGLTIATNLARAGKDVLIIESGSKSRKPQPNRASEIGGCGGDMGAGQAWPRGLGGASTQWGGRLLPITAHDLGHRAYLSIEAWPLSFEELDVYRPQIEKLFCLDNSSYEEDVLDQLLPPDLLPRPDPDFTCRLPKSTSFRNRNIFFLLRKEIAQRRNVEIWTSATAFDFELDRTEGRVTAVRARAADNRILNVRANDFIITAGTLESTRLLLLLDRTSSGHAFKGCTVLGRYFQEHLKADVGELRQTHKKSANRMFGYHIRHAMRRSLHLELTPEVQEIERVASAYLTVRFEFPQNSALYRIINIARGQQRGVVCSRREALSIVSDLGFLTRAAFWKSYYKQILLPVGTRIVPEIRIEQVPHWNNRITLSDKLDRLGIPQLKVEWQATPLEERTFRTVMGRVAGYWKRTGLDQICPIKWNETLRDRSRPIVDLARKTWHPSGSTRMGTNPAQSVVSPSLRCHAVPNIVVVSASTFPSSGSINPTLTILQLALRASESIATSS